MHSHLPVVIYWGILNSQLYIAESSVARRVDWYKFHCNNTYHSWVKSSFRQPIQRRHTITLRWHPFYCPATNLLIFPPKNFIRGSNTEVASGLLPNNQPPSLSNEMCVQVNYGMGPLVLHILRKRNKNKMVDLINHMILVGLGILCATTLCWQLPP